MSKNENIVTVLASTAHDSALDELFIYPKRIMGVGISEEWALTISGGLSISSYRLVVSIYSTFIQLTYDELSHDVARMNLVLTILIDLAGLVGNNGNIHLETLLYSIPNVSITMASGTSETASLLNHHSPFAIRYPGESV